MAEWRRGPILGRGSSATVSLAAASPSGDLFAVKSAELSKSEMLQTEQRILSTINCPQIVSFLGFEVTQLHFNLFLEFAPGGSLSDNINGHLDELTVRHRTNEILTGLSYLHSRGIVHCDIKPQNILIGSDGRAKIADLGCARWLDEASYQVKGTPMFMAPEVARGEEQGPAADVWALGCTVLEMITGTSPWTESDPITALHRIGFSMAVPEIPSWVSDEGKDFLSKTLVRDPNQRWTVDQLLEHPFAKLCSTKPNLNKNWTSPKTTLDWEMWEMFSDEDDDDENEESDSRGRILELEDSCECGPNWTWDDNWMAIRSNDDGCSIRRITDGDEVAALDSPVLISNISSRITQDFDSFASEFYDYILDRDYDFTISNWEDVNVVRQRSSCKLMKIVSQKIMMISLCSDSVNVASVFCYCLVFIFLLFVHIIGQVYRKHENGHGHFNLIRRSTKPILQDRILTIRTLGD